MKGRVACEFASSVSLHHTRMRSVRLYSINGGVCEFTSHNHEKCETILNEGWCANLHHKTMRRVGLNSTNGGV